MKMIPLTRTEASFLHAAAKAEGRLHFVPTIKPASRERLIGRFLRDTLITPADAPDGQYRLTPVGYEAIGHAPPAAPISPPRANKKAQVLALLAREEGATLAELMAATGWLAHTTLADPVRGTAAGEGNTRRCDHGLPHPATPARHSLSPAAQR